MRPRALTEHRLAQVLLFVTPALWSVNYLVARWAPGVIAPHALTLGRWCVAAALLGWCCRAELRAGRAHLRAEWRRCLVLGALGMWICGSFVYIGAHHTTAISIGLLYALAPVLIAAGAACWLGDRLARWQWCGVALAMAGTLVILFQGRWAALRGWQVNPGDLWIAGAVVAWAAYSLLLRHWRSAFSPLARLTCIALAGIVVLLPLALGEAWIGPAPPASWQAAALVLAAGLLPGAGAYGAYAVMQRALGPARVGLVLYLGPPYTAAVAWAVLGERIQWFHGAGALLILPGIWLATRRVTTH